MPLAPQDTHTTLLREFAAGSAPSTLARRHHLPTHAVHRELRLAIRRHLATETGGDRCATLDGDMRLERLLRRGCTADDIAQLLGLDTDRVTSVRTRILQAGDRLPKPRPSGGGVKLRACMACAELYPSEGIHNRLCLLCRDGTGLPESWNYA